MSDPSLPGSTLTARRLVLATAIYALLAVIYTWPAVTGLGSQVIAGPRDGPMFLWNTWWGPHALFELHEDPLFTRHAFFPKGTSLVFNTHALLPSLASWPLQKLFGLVAAFNGMVLLAFVLAGVGALLLTNEVARDWRAGLVAGAIFAFGDLRLSTLMFFNLSQNWMLPIWAWALWRALRLRSWRWSLAAGAIGAAIFWTDYNLVVFAAAWGLAFAIHALIDVRRHGATRLGLLARWGAMALLLGALCLPLARSVRTEFKAVERFVSGNEIETALQSTPLDYLVIRDPKTMPGADAPLTLRHASFLGYATLLLAAWGIGTRRRERSTRFLAAVALLFLLVALGYELNLGDSALPAPDQPVRMRLPYAWLRDLPVIREIHTPHRFGIVAWIAIALLAGLGMGDLLARLRAARLPAWFGERRAAAAATALACAGVMADFTRFPFPVLCRLPPIAAPIAAIAADPRDCAVLAWPAGRRGDPFFAYYNTVHGKPQYLDGQTARRVESLTQLQERSRVRQLLAVLFLEEEPDWGRIAALTRGAEQELRNQRVGWVVLSQFDLALLSVQRDPWTLDHLHAIDARIRRAMPGLEPAWHASDAELQAFAAAFPGKRWSLGTLFAVYRLPLP